jgi:hypothetical protein
VLPRDVPRSGLEGTFERAYGWVLSTTRDSTLKAKTPGMLSPGNTPVAIARRMALFTKLITAMPLERYLSQYET